MRGSSDLLAAVARGARAWCELGDLARLVGRPREAVEEEVAALVATGWLAIWALPWGLSVTLSALAAERLGLVLTEAGRDEVPVWIEATRAPQRTVIPAERLARHEARLALTGHRPRRTWVERLIDLDDPASPDDPEGR